MSTVIEELLRPLAFVVTQTERIYWLYLFGAISIGYLVYLRQKYRVPNTRQEDFWHFIAPRDIFFHPSAVTDYWYFYVNTFIRILIIVPTFASTSLGVAAGVEQLLRLTNNGYSGILAPTDPWVMFAFTVALAIAADYGIFLAHYLQHRIPLLWEFHKVHHSAEVLTPVTVYRMHPVDDVLTFAVVGVATGAVSAIFFYLCDGRLSYYNVLGLNTVTVVFYFAGYNLRHSHIWVDYGPFWSQFFISPAQHQIHHSGESRHFDKNLGFMLAIWDRMAGTLYVPKEKEAFRLGISPEDHATLHSTWQLFLMPFVNVARRLRSQPLFRPQSAAAMALVIAILGPAYVQSQSYSAAPTMKVATVFLEDMTWQEVRDALQAGYNTVIVPTGGTEQNGPHMILGKHNYIVKHTAAKIAEKLGNALVAPVMAYVPEGAVTPPEGHMRYAGTLSIPEDVFAAVLESTARSLKQHGFRKICFLGDSGGNQRAQQVVAEKLREEWKQEHVVVVHVGEYYSGNGQIRYLADQKIGEDAIGSHAGIRDTSELLAVRPEGIRLTKLADNRQVDSDAIGSNGNSLLATPQFGQALLELKINAALRQINDAAPPQIILP